MRKAVINRIDGATAFMQTATIHGLEGELSTNVERYQNYGFTSYPLPIDENGHGAEVILVDAGGSSLKSIVATDDRRYRPTDGDVGETILYTNIDKTTTHRVTLKNNGDIELNTGSSVVTLSSNGTVNINASTININADVNFTGALTSNGKNISDGHTHISVQPGSGTSGPAS